MEFRLQPVPNHARLLSSPPRLTLQVAPPLEEGQLPPTTSYTAEERQARAILLAALAKAAAQTDGLRLELTAPTDNADVVLRLQDGHLWLLEPGAERVTEGPRKTPSIAVTNTQALAGVVATHLYPLTKALNLLRLAMPLDAAASAVPLAVELWWQAKGAPDCQRIASKPGAALNFNPGDKLKVTFRNEGRAPVDVTVLYIDSRYGITALYPGGGVLNRLLPGNQESVEGAISAKTTGQERMLIIATRAVGTQQDFTYLAQASVPETVKEGPQEPDTRGSSRGEVLAFEDTLLRAGFGQSATRTRAFDQTTPASETATLRVLEWRVAAPVTGSPAN